MTFNEINNQANYEEDFAPFTNSGIAYQEGEDREAIMYQAAHYELVASARAVKIGHAINPDFQIGCMIAMVPIYPYSCNPEDMMMSVSAMQNVIGLPMFMSAVIIKCNSMLFETKNISLDVTEEDLTDLANGCVDYIGFSYYMSFAVKGAEKAPTFDYNEAKDLVRNPYVATSDWGWQIDPMGLRYAMNWFNDRYELPLLLSKMALVLLMS